LRVYAKAGMDLAAVPGRCLAAVDPLVDGGLLVLATRIVSAAEVAVGQEGVFRAPRGEVAAAGAENVVHFHHAVEMTGVARCLAAGHKGVRALGMVAVIVVL